MGNANSADQPVSTSTWKRRIKKVVLRGGLAIGVVAGAAQAGYTYSGSNQWESVGERNGVKVYSMKSPGSNIMKFKAIWRVRTTMSKFVMFAQQEETDMNSGYYDMRDIDVPSEQLIWSTWKQAFPSPFMPREFVTKNEFSQDPTTKELLFTVTAAPEKLPADDCCVRVTLMTNHWRLTPLKDGEVEVEWFVDMDMGGFIPYFLQNKYQPIGMRNFARSVQGFLDRDKYRNAKYDWIQEPQADQPAGEFD